LLSHDGLAIDFDYDGDFLIAVGGTHEFEIEAEEPVAIGGDGKIPCSLAAEAVCEQPAGGHSP
jgi:hypothetical protein